MKRGYTSCRPLAGDLLSSPEYTAMSSYSRV